MSAGERTDTRRRWALAAAASLAIHASLFLWWRGIDLAPGSGPAGGRAGDGGTGFAPGSVIEVQIDVEAPVLAGTTIPAEQVVETPLVESIPVVPTTDVSPSETHASATESPRDSTGVGASLGASGAGGLSGQGSGEGSAGNAQGVGTGDGGVPGGVGVRLGGSTSGGGPGGTVPPRPIEITWPDTRRLSHCVGLRIDVRIRVDEQGRATQVEPASAGAPDDCVRAALETARNIKFAPGTVAGKPAALWSLVTIDFEKKK